MKKLITIGFGRTVSIADVVAVAYGARVAISPRTRRVLTERRGQIVRYVTSNQFPAYGFNRGFGHNVDTKVSLENADELQLNLVRSHAAGVGEPLPIAVVRAAMVLRAHSLALGHSGVRYDLVKLLIDLLNHRITPVVPSFGSVGASGDLAPLAHIALAMIGEGEVFHKEGTKRLSSKLALQRARLTPLRLQMKEGLALTNGAQISTALAIIAQHEMDKLLQTAALTTALSAQVLLGSDEPFAPELHALRPHPGATIVAGWIFRLMKKSPIREFHRDPQLDGKLQDPYSLRCAPQVLGSCYDLLQQSRAILQIEANSVTDNPLILPERKNKGKFTRILSGGHFHGMPVAIALYNQLQAMGIIGRLSNMRAVRYVDEKRNDGLGKDLIWPELSPAQRSTSSGMMVPEYVSAALTNFIWGAAMPSHLFSLSTDAGQEDHVSMSAGLGVRVYQTVSRLAEVLAIELAFASQAAAIRKVSPNFPVAAGATRRWPRQSRQLNRYSERVLRRVQQVLPILKRDRSLSPELIELAKVVRSGELLTLAGFSERLTKPRRRDS